MFPAALFAFASKWKQRKYPSTEVWINNLQYIYTVNKLWQTTTTNMNLTKILSKISQTQRNIHITLFLQNLKKGKTST